MLTSNIARKTKIVCTMGPATASDSIVTELIKAGMNVARLNFSHGDHNAHEQMYQRIRKAALALGAPIGVLADLQGPKIRLGKFISGKTIWNTGEIIKITIDEILGNHDRVSTTYKSLTIDAVAGDRILVDDGKIALVVKEVDLHDVTCLVVEGGEVSDNKGVSLPGMNISVPALSEKDIDDLEFALKLGVDFVALSFVRSPGDVDTVHEVMDRIGITVPIIAKLEKPEAVDNLESVIMAFDAVMIARGDLGVELPLEKVPLVQKKAIQIARENAKPVIVATQMLDSMIHNSRPTRAEVSDVANAVFDGTDAVMLSGETAVGSNVVETVRTMAKIVSEAETSGIPVPVLNHVPRTKRGVISFAAREIGERLHCKGLVAFTQSGDTVKRLARLHSYLPLLAFTPNESVRNQLSLSWGTVPFLVPQAEDTDEMMKYIDKDLPTLDGFNKGDQVVIVAGAPPSKEGSTNFVRVHRVGELD